MASDYVHRCLSAGMSVLVGSVNQLGQPSCCRAHRLASSDNLTTATVYVPVATSQPTIANVASTQRIAVAATYPPDHFSVQLKGTVSDVRLAHDDERAAVEAGRDAFAEVLFTLGVPRHVVRNVVAWPAFAIAFRVEEVYEQTPGPRAGVRVQ